MNRGEEKRRVSLPSRDVRVFSGPAHETRRGAFGWVLQIAMIRATAAATSRAESGPEIDRARR